MKSFKKYFKHSIEYNFPETSKPIILNIEREYESISKSVEFAAKSSNPIDRRLNFSAYFLALVKVLDNQGENYETIRLISLGIVKEYVKPKNIIHSAFKKVPLTLIGTPIATRFLKLFNQKVNVKGHPDGFLATIITDKKETYGLGYGIDILECGICKLFKNHQLERYATILCEVDEITSGIAGLDLIRKGTIANGAQKCDFRFKRAK